MEKQPKYKIDVYLDDVRRRKESVREELAAAEAAVQPSPGTGMSG